MKRNVTLVLALASLVAFASQAFAQVDVWPPNHTTDLSIMTGKTTATATFTVAGDDCNSGTCSNVEIRRSTSAIDDSNWNSATQVYYGSPGDGSCIDLGAGQSCNTTYYWAMKSFDDQGQASPVSNSVMKATRGCGPGNPEVTCFRDVDAGDVPVTAANLDLFTPVA